jgi:hypothetical protein
MGSKSVAILLVGSALWAGLQYVSASNRISASVDTGGTTSSSSSHRESVVAVKAVNFEIDTAKSAGELASPENAIVHCAGGADVTGNDCM